MTINQFMNSLKAKKIRLSQKGKSLTKRIMMLSEEISMKERSSNLGHALRKEFYKLLAQSSDASEDNLNKLN